MIVRLRTTSPAAVWLCICAAAVSRGAGPASKVPVNVAPKATITATSVHSGRYLGEFVADGRIPTAGCKNDYDQAWAVKGDTHRNGAELLFEWSGQVTVAEIVYFGRTAWMADENWKDYEVYLDSDSKPCLKGQLKPGHGPQRIKLPKTVKVSRIRLKFTSSYGGFNPGASEIQIYSVSPSAAVLGRLVPPRLAVGGVSESPQLASDLRSGKLGFDKLIVIHRNAINSSHVYTYHAEGFRPGGGLYVLSLKDGALKRLIDASQGEILDCNISYEGDALLFSWKKTVADTYHVYRMNVDGTGLRQITKGKTHNMNACWLPDGGIVFLSDRKPAFAYCWNTTSPILYRSDGQGGNIVRLSANYLNDFTPSVMPDGRIIYSRWEYVDRPAIPIQGLWTINQDGTNLAGYFGNRVLSPGTFMEAREIPGTNKVLCVLTAHGGPCRGGIGIIDPSKGANAQEAITNLTPEVNIGKVDRGSGNDVRGPYESPYPLDDKYYLVSRGGTVLLRDYEGARQVTILPKAGALGYYSPQPVRASKRPKVRSSPLQKGADDWATLTLQDVYNGLEPHVRRGEITQIAVVQEIEKPVRAEVSRRAFGFQFPVVSCGATYAPKRVWGYAKVEEDGSANFTVPAGLPIYFMALDAHGRALQRMRSFTHLMPGEIQGCVGCHADRNYATPSAGRKRPIAALRAPQELDKPEWGVVGFSYARIVQPVFDKHCVKCHNATEAPKGVDLSPDKTDFFNVSYEVLARQGNPGQTPYTKWIPSYNGQEANILLITPKYWGSPASKLGEIIMKDHPDKDQKPKIKLTSNEKRRLFAWMDLNVPYYGTSSSNHYNLRGCRRILPPNLEKALQEVAARRCVSCHKARGGASFPRKEYIRITNVENNNFLLSPLAKAAGGTGKCGKAVFADKDDADYRKIVATFEPVARLIKAVPRKDMPNSGFEKETCRPGN